MLENMNFYRFMHRQIPVVIGLFAGTGMGYLYMGWLYAYFYEELLWFTVLLLISLWGVMLYREYSIHEMNMQEKEAWLKRLNYFLFTYFSMWTLIFLMYVSRSDIELHYVAIATQLGASVVSTTILASQRKLAIITLVSMMLPLTIYFIGVGEFYSYLIAFFSVVLSGVLLYASSNTYSYLVKSQFQAYHDYLTRLGNRRYFIELLEDAITVQKKEHRPRYLLLIDLDHFKTINDSLGHDIGDRLLREVANRMQHLSGEYRSHVCRLGGDEFCILSDTFDSAEEGMEEAKRFAQRLLQSIKTIYEIEGHHLYISASIGVSLLNNPNMTAGKFIKEADIAMYEAKSLGRDGVMIFNDELAERVEWKLEIERLLHFALDKDEISLQYQPQLDTEETLTGCEVLARWYSEELGHVSPAAFIPVAEQTGLIIELGHHILEESFKTLKAWDEAGIDLQQMSVNISMRQLSHTAFLDQVKGLVERYLDARLCAKLVFEITETVVAEDINSLISQMQALRRFGIRFSIDDFGTGYSSLSYLRQIPLDELKIDKSFVAELENAEQGKIIKTIIDIAKNLNLTIVAEGVEKAFQKEFLTEQQCDILQGYYFSKPLERAEFEAFARR